MEISVILLGALVAALMVGFLWPSLPWNKKETAGDPLRRPRNERGELHQWLYSEDEMTCPKCGARPSHNPRPTAQFY